MKLPAMVLAASFAALPFSTARAAILCTAFADAATGKVLKQDGACSSACRRPRRSRSPSP